MPKSQKQQIWVYKPTPPKFTAADKTKILTKVKEIVSIRPKLAKKFQELICGQTVFIYMNWSNNLK